MGEEESPLSPAKGPHWSVGNAGTRGIGELLSLFLGSSALGEAIQGTEKTEDKVTMSEPDHDD